MRSRETGQWDLRAVEPVPPTGEIPIVARPLPEKNELAQWLTIALPQALGPIGVYAQTLVPHIDAKLILPAVANLLSYDGNHLDASGVAWSNVFLDQLDKLGPDCGAW